MLHDVLLDMLPVTVPDGLVPDSVLWWQKGWGIRDQTLYPSGWAVSATRAVEAQIKRKTGLEMHNLLYRAALLRVPKLSRPRKIFAEAKFSYIKCRIRDTYVFVTLGGVLICQSVFTPMKCTITMLPLKVLYLKYFRIWFKNLN